MKANRQITRNNHYVPQFYLRYWSNNGNTIYTYNGIIKNEAMRGWRSTSIKKTAFWSDFYTDTLDSCDDDKFERLLHDYEDAAKPAFEKVKSETQLNDEDMAALIQFLIVQAARTPSFLLFGQQLLKEVFPSTVEDTFMQVDQQIADGSIRERVLLSETEEANDLHAMPMKLNIDSEKLVAEVETCTGRQNFIATALNFIEGPAAKRLQASNWKVVKTADSLLTSDNPVVFLHLHESNEWSVGLEYGMVRFPTLVYMPLTPHHLLITQIGRAQREVDSIQPARALVDLIQQGTVYNAKRYIYANNEDMRVGKCRLQCVDPQAFDALDDERTSWHESNIELEKEFDVVQRRKNRS